MFVFYLNVFATLVCLVTAMWFMSKGYFFPAFFLLVIGIANLTAAFRITFRRTS